jgi:hypothetical protein
MAPGEFFINVSMGVPSDYRTYKYIMSENRTSGYLAIHGGHGGKDAALAERPGLVAGWREREPIETNNRMLRNLLDPPAAARQASAPRDAAAGHQGKRRACPPAFGTGA